MRTLKTLLICLSTITSNTAIIVNKFFKYNLSLLLLTFLVSTIVSAQSYNEDVTSLVSPASIPSAPAFSLLGVNPELVLRPADVKQFKVDWRIKNYKIAPDLALEAQPLWWLYYRRKTPTELLKSSKLEQILATTSVSLATAKIDNVNHLSWAWKVNVYKEKDPLFDLVALKKKQKELNKSIEPLQHQQDSLRLLFKIYKHIDTLRKVSRLIEAIDYEIKVIRENTMETLKNDAQKLSAEHWNKDMIDVGFGRVYTYDNAAIDSFNLRKAGWGLWINAARGIKKKGLVTGIIRINRVGINTDFHLGVSYRYGSEKYNFFTELIYDRMNNMPENGFLDEEQFQEKHNPDLGIGWYGFKKGDTVTKWTLAYGGDFKLRENILLNFALRVGLNEDFLFKSLLPIANVICLMQ